MASPDSKKYVTIHGHFYQPPRENPWLGLIERQESAFPSHDWNDRIAFQCYCTNARAHILDPNSSIETLFNNYIYLNFNFGPTLLSWLALMHPKTYRRILKADAISQELNGGHGNAIAQAYNHMILPLANTQDKHTQIIWGIEDFKFHFKRDPEALWLAETAINYETVSTLIDHNITYIILAPTQAQRVTELGKDAWNDVSNSTINPRRPYRLFDINDKGEKLFNRYLDVFFYDGPLSSAVSFEHLLRQAEGFGSRIEGAFDHYSNEPQLVNIATDGESYGHHEPYGDMGLAYLYYKVLKQKNITPINYGYFLELFPPKHEVEIKRGPNNEGTAWSCAHGVGRWYRDCGCTTGGESWWNQQWRTPLRNAFNELRLRLDEIFENEGKKLFNNVWDARNEYIHIMLDPGSDSKKQFIEKQCTKLGSDNEQNVWQLLEMQRYGMYMFTSCGWFFSDITGMEPVQNMCYAKRAIDYASAFTKTNLEENLLAILDKAKSNHPYVQTGKQAYIQYVLPQVFDTKKLVHSFVVSHMQHLDISFPAHDIQPIEQTEITIDDIKATIGKVKIEQYTTSMTRYYFFAVAYTTKLKIRCILSETTLDAPLETFRQSLPLANGKEALLDFLNKEGLSLRDIPHEQRTQVMHTVIHESESQFRKLFEDFYTSNQELLETISESNIALPPVLKAITEYVLTNRFSDAFSDLLAHYDFDNCSDAYMILNEGKKYGLTVNKTEAIESMGNLILSHLIKVEQQLNLENCKILLEMLNFSKSLNFYFENGGKIVNRIWRIINHKGVPLVQSLVDPVKDYPNYMIVLKLIEIAEKVNFSALQLKKHLKSFEDKLAENPRERFS